MAARDLAGWPPEQLVGRVGRARWVVAQVARLAAREQQAAQHGPVGPRPDVRPGFGGDHGGGDVGLLGGQAALLDRVRRDVADGVDAFARRARA